jgi:hypothetical protein
MVKYFIRRLIAGVVIVPLTGLAYLVVCGLLVALGAGQNNSALGFYEIGCWLGVCLTLAFALDVFWKE